MNTTELSVVHPVADWLTRAPKYSAVIDGSSPRSELAAIRHPWKRMLVPQLIRTPACAPSISQLDTTTLSESFWITMP